MADGAVIILEGRMFVFVQFLLHERFMAGLAELVPLFPEKVPVGGAVATVAGGAVPFLDGIMNAVFLVFAFFFHVAPVTNRVGPVDQDMTHVGAMRIVTGSAVGLLKRRMLILQLLPIGLGPGMTAVAQRPGLLVYQSLEGSGMDRVAGQAAFLADERFVGDPDFLAGILVTGKAEGIAAGDQQVPVFRRVDLMARETVAALERFMLHGPPGHQVAPVMTGVADIAPFFRGGKGIGG